MPEDAEILSVTQLTREIRDVLEGHIGSVWVELEKLDRVELRSGLIASDTRTLHVAHWMLDPATGQPWGTSEAKAITFDLDARKVVPITPAAQDALQAFAVEGLGL